MQGDRFNPAELFFGRYGPLIWVLSFSWVLTALLLIARRQVPAATVAWMAFGLLIAGITITFYRPRRRVWTRLTPDGRLGIVWRSDRYVDVEREFGRLLDQLVAARRPG